MRSWEPISPRGALALCTIPNRSTIGQWGWGFYTVRGGFDPGDHRFYPQVVGVVKVLNGLQSGDETLSSQGGAGFILAPKRINDRPAGVGFSHRAGRCRPGE